MLKGGGGSIFDIGLLTSVHGSILPGLIRPAQFVTALGGWQVLILLSIIGAAILYRRGERRNALYLVIFCLWGRAVVGIVKWLTDRPRPDFLDHLASSYSSSFPSGHAANATITYCALAILLAPRSPLALGAALALSFIIGFSRLVLGVHWPTDVIGGWALGLIWAFALHRLIQLPPTTAPAVPHSPEKSAQSGTPQS